MDDLKGAFEELVSTMRRSGFAYPETLREGLSEAEALDQTSELPFALPDEVVRLYALCSRKDVDIHSKLLPVGFFGGHRMLTLSESLYWYHFFAEIAVDDDALRVTWFPLFTDMYRFMFVMTEESDGRNAPLIDIEGEDRSGVLIVSGIKELFIFCTGLINAGAFHPDLNGRERGRGAMLVNQDIYKKVVPLYDVDVAIW